MSTRSQKEYLNNFREHLLASGKSVSTVQSYCRDLQTYIDHLSRLKKTVLRSSAVELDDLVDHLIVDKGERINSARRLVIAVRQFYRMLVQQRVLRESVFDRYVVPKRDEVLPAQLSVSEVDALFAAKVSEQELVNLRNKSLLVLLAYEGLKVTELISLKWVHFDASGGYLFVPGLKARRITLDSFSIDTLENYYQSMVDTQKELSLELGIAPHEVVPLESMFFGFKGRTAGRKIQSLTRHGVKFILYEIGEFVGIDHLNTETLRHYAIRHKLDKGLSMEEVMEHLGLKKAGNILKHCHHRVANI